MKRSICRRPLAFKILLVVPLLVLASAACSTTSQASSGGSPITRMFTVSVPARLMVNNDVGTIHVHPGSGTTVVVQATKHRRGEAADPQITMNQTDSRTVRIETHCPPGSSVDLDVTMPSASQLQLQTGAGNIRIEGINGQVNAETGAGSLSATSITGQANLRTGAGLITVSQARLNGNSLLHTGSGGISFDGSLDPKGAYRLESGSGWVNLTLPANSSLSLDLHMGIGWLKNSFGSNETGSPPRARVFIETDVGSITINKR